MGSSNAEELEGIVAALKSESDLDERGKEILAGAVTLLGAPRHKQQAQLRALFDVHTGTPTKPVGGGHRRTPRRDGAELAGRPRVRRDSPARAVFMTLGAGG